jgi:hypothetical protein
LLTIYKKINELKKIFNDMIRGLKKTD